MSTQQSQGSIVLKLLILLLAVALVVVILIPGDIWDKEEHDTIVCRGNLESIFEAERFYFSNYQQYTEDPLVLISTIQEDSTLAMRQKIVALTQRVRSALDNFLTVPIVKRLTDISQNMVNIETDIENNERYFTRFPQIQAEAEDLKLKLSTLRSGVEYQSYRQTSLSLDSLLELRRDLTDYSLQEIARRSSELSMSIMAQIPNVNFKSMEEYWNPLDALLTVLMNDINSSELKTVTSIADRIVDFQAAITIAFADIRKNNLGTNYSDAQNAAETLDVIYKEFLTEYLITERAAMYRIAETDSMLLGLTQEHFKTPVDGLNYIMTFSDSAYLSVECPLQATYIATQALTQVEAINRLPILPAFNAYQAKLDSTRKSYMEAKQQYRRNTEIFIKTKELDLAIETAAESFAWISYLDLKQFTEKIPGNNSYTEIKSILDKTLISVGNFKQIFGDQIFGKLDTAHTAITKNLQELNDILSTVRRNTITMDSEINDLETALSQIKSIAGGSVVPELTNVEASLQQLYLDLSEGESRTVNGIFSTKVLNHGKVFGVNARKSWEEE